MLLYKITEESGNPEVLYKLLKTTAAQYGCIVTYEKEKRTVSFQTKDENLIKGIVEEVLSFFEKK